MCISQNRRIIACNEVFAIMFRNERKILVGQSLIVLYPTPDEFERTGERISLAMSSTRNYSDERIMKRADQALFWCRVNGRSLVANDVHASCIWTFEDLSAKRGVPVDLTPREREIAALLVEGKTSKLIARQIGLSPRTVEMHRAKLMRKLGATTSTDLVHRLGGLTTL
jgi:DNA-binding CsgD family transcriptional regulator